MEIVKKNLNFYLLVSNFSILEEAMQENSIWGCSFLGEKEELGKPNSAQGWNMHVCIYFINYDTSS